MRIAVAGTGYVGLVAGVCFAERGQQVICVDVDQKKVEKMQSGICPIYENDLEELMQKNYALKRIDYTTDYQKAYKNAEAIFIGVGTPERPDGSANLDYIFAVAKQIAETIENDCVVVVKSTVPVGTNDVVEEYIRKNLKHKVNVDVASNPEFLAQGTAVRDTLQAKRIVIGTETESAKKVLMDLYGNFGLPIVATNRRSAEMIKYASNDFLALKISFMNDIANLCELVGANIEDVAKGMSLDSRIGDKFLHAGCGYGGSCFPKDTKALYQLGLDYGYELRTVKSAIDVNHDQKAILFTKAKQKSISFKNKKVAVLGLTFKAGTDDLREAPSLDNVKLLLDEGAKITAYDPVGIPNYKKIYPTQIEYVDSPITALKDAEVCFIFTEWAEIKNVKIGDYIENMKKPVVFDGRNILNKSEAIAAGIEYYSIGR